MPNLYKISEISRILMLIACCALSNAQVLYVGDFCDFAGYVGTCLEASKCFDLQPIMQSMGYESYHVGRCGFAIREEIICCPKWPTPVQTPPQLRNEYIDLSQRPEFGITTSKPMINNNQERVQDEYEKLRAPFNGNFGQAGNGLNVAEYPLGNANNNYLEQPGNGFNIGKSGPLGNGNNNGILCGNPVTSVKKNQNLNGKFVNDELLKAIFCADSVHSGNGNRKVKRKQKHIPVLNANNKRKYNANSTPIENIDNNAARLNKSIQDENALLNAIFNTDLNILGSPTTKATSSARFQ